MDMQKIFESKDNGSRRNDNPALATPAEATNRIERIDYEVYSSERVFSGLDHAAAMAAVEKNAALARKSGMRK